MLQSIRVEEIDVQVCAIVLDCGDFSRDRAGPAPQPQVAQTAKDPLDKIVCRTEEGLGSRLNRKRVCMSLRDWKEQADDARNATERMQQMNADQMKPDG